MISEKQILRLKPFLNRKFKEYNRLEFIQDDPIQIPKMFTGIQDIEISGFFAATLAWGQRKTIISKCKELIASMDNAPYDFVKNHKARDLQRLSKFKHRTFNYIDLLYFIEFFKHHYINHNSLEDAFIRETNATNTTMEEMLSYFHGYFFSIEDYPIRTKKHVATPERKSACKRINMFLRWMVRKDKRVDFGLWTKISPGQLICPIDVHVERVARKLNLIKRKQVDWLTAVELTESLKMLDPDDPVKYDFALFGLGVNER